MYIWNTWPICLLINRLWKAQHPFLSLEGTSSVPPYTVELMSVLERTLNVAHTGNIRVIATRLMNVLHVGLALVEHGFPAFFPELVIPSASSEAPYIKDINWPRVTKTGMPIVASKRAQMLTYGPNHYEVSLYSHFHILSNHAWKEPVPSAQAFYPMPSSSGHDSMSPEICVVHSSAI
jgi:hypothetical protein